jgi:hypothetical protein
MKKLLFFSLLVLISSNVFPKNIIDSLSNKLKSASSDTTKSAFMLKLAYEYINIDRKKTIEYLNEAKKLSEKANYKKGLANYYYVNGLLTMNNSPEALENFKKSLQFFSESHNKLWMANVIAQIGTIYSSCLQLIRQCRNL